MFKHRNFRSTRRFVNKHLPAWLSRYKKISRKMNRHHFMFYLLYICNLHNQSKINQLWLFRAYNYVIVLQLPLIILSMHVTGPRRHAYTKDGYIQDPPWDLKQNPTNGVYMHVYNSDPGKIPCRILWTHRRIPSRILQT